MDDFQTGVYVKELFNQCQSAFFAADDFNAALTSEQNRPASVTVGRAFTAIQGLLSAAAMVSKMLWPNPPSVGTDGKPLDEEQQALRQWATERGRVLRQPLGIKAMPILERRAVRNSLEHFDDRLDKWLMEGSRCVIDRNIGPRDSLVVVDGETPRHLRLIDPTRGTVSVLADEIVINDLVNALVQVRRAAAAWNDAHR